MADARLKFELVSPERLLMDVHAGAVDLPGAEGDMTILPGHAPVMSTIRPGVIHVRDVQGGEETKIFIRGGFIEATAERLIVLAEEAIPLSELDQQDIDQRLQDAKEDLEDAETDEATRIAQEAISRLQALKAAVS